ncbi:hypothetical protein [Salinicola peritrichatus]|uniref:hypothetical protein n=1 Tax=Salinicola peritrichatus TaxID=1267424 RepID=UPI000DA1E462|nr:hypothetical protein [Salinicola peritrichatus]
MPGTEFLTEQVRRERERGDRERRRGNWSYGLMVVAVIGAIVVGYLWFKADNRVGELTREIASQQADYKRRLDDQAADYKRQLAREKRINDDYSARITRLWAANAVAVGSLIYERKKAGDLAADNKRIWRRNRDLQEDKQRMRENWTSELSIDQ